MMTEKFLTKRECADLYKVNPKTIERWIADGKIKAVKIGQTVRVVVASLPGVK